MKILFLTQIACFPPDAGEKLRSFNLIHSILEFSDTLYLVSGNAPPREATYSKVKYFPFPSGYYSQNRWKDLSLLFRRNKDLEKAIRSILDTEPVELAFLDYYFLGNYISLFKERGIKVIYGTHNVQPALNHQTPAKTLKDRLYKKVRLLLETRHEQRYYPQSDALICVSEQDQEWYQNHYKNLPVFLIPNYIHEAIYKNSIELRKKNQIIMAANYSAFQNKYGLQWFLEKVWDEELASLTTLIVAGHRSVSVLENLKQEGISTAGVQALGTVDDMKKSIAESKAAIIPLLHGSGTRLKCIEAMALKTSIISTTVGAQGIDHNGSILLADDPSDFKTAIIRILQKKIQPEESAYQVFLNKYSSKANTPRLKKILSEQ
ncbi:MAG: glycosyltransferase [Bacteroidales bacterium]